MITLYLFVGRLNISGECDAIDTTSYEGEIGPPVLLSLFMRIWQDCSMVCALSIGCIKFARHS